MISDKLRVAVFLQSPIDYTAGLMRKLSEVVKLKIFYGSDFALLKPMFVKEYNKTVKWDMNMIQDLDCTFLRNFSPWRNHEFNPGIIRELVANKYDLLIIRAYDSFTSWMAFIVARLLKMPVLFIGETDLFKSTASWLTCIKKVVLPVLLNNVAAVMYSCTSNAEYFESYGVPKRKMFFVPSAVDNDFYRKRAVVLEDRKLELKIALGIPIDLPVILTVSKLIDRKRILDILSAFITVQHKSYLLIVGEGPQRAELEQFVQQHEISNVSFVGFKNRTEISEFYTLADIFLLASEWDPSPKALQEAMNFSVAVVLSDHIGTAQDLVIPGVNGFVYPLSDINALSQYLGQVLDGPFISMGERSFEIISEWNYDKGVSGFLEAFEFALKGRQYE